MNRCRLHFILDHDEIASCINCLLKLARGLKQRLGVCCMVHVGHHITWIRHMNLCGLFLHLVTWPIGASERLVKHLACQECVCFSSCFSFFLVCWGGACVSSSLTSLLELLLSYINIHNVCNTFFGYGWCDLYISYYRSVPKLWGQICQEILIPDSCSEVYAV